MNLLFVLHIDYTSADIKIKNIGTFTARSILLRYFLSMAAFHTIATVVLRYSLCNDTGE